MLIVCHVATGEVVSVAIMNDKYIGGGQSRGYGFDKIPSVSEDQAAITASMEKHLDIGQLMLFRPSLFLATNGPYSHKREACTVGITMQFYPSD